MKYLKLTLPRKEGSGEFQYPSNYADLQPFIKNNLYVDDAGTCVLLLVVEDGAEKVCKENVEKLTKAAMTTYADQFDKKTEKITDEAKVRRLEILAKAGDYKLTADDLKALDPADATPGVEYRKTFSETL